MSYFNTKDININAVHHPFQLLTIRLPSGGTKYGVYYRSGLFKSIWPKDKQAITGLLTKENPDATDSGWFSLYGGGYVWLEITFKTDTGEIDSAKIVNSNQGSFNFDSGPIIYDTSNKDNPSSVKKVQKLIAYITAGSDGVTQLITQTMKTDQVMTSICMDGLFFKYPMPWDGGYNM